MDEHGVGVRVGARVRELRRAAGLSQSELGERIGVTFQQIQKYENGSNRIAASKLWLISQSLGIPASAFLADLPEPDAQGDDVTRRLVRAWARIPSTQREPLLILIETLASDHRAKRRSRPLPSPVPES